MKQFYLQQNIGTVKYLLNYHNGERTHKDGSPFFDIKGFSNKKKLESFTKGLVAQGYTEK